ncbi:MAG: hypothetical protein AAGC79_05860 [Pseudomonadota bacterium]
MLSNFFRAFDFVPLLVAGLLLWVGSLVSKEADWMQEHGVGFVSTVVEKFTKVGDDDRKHYIVIDYEVDQSGPLRKRMRIDADTFADIELGDEVALTVSPSDPSQVTFDAASDFKRGEGLEEFGTIIGTVSIAWLLYRSSLAWRAYRAVHHGKRVNAVVTKLQKPPFKPLFSSGKEDDEKVKLYWEFEDNRGRKRNGRSLKRYRKLDLFYLKPGSAIQVHALPGSRVSFWSKEMGTGEG